MKSNYERKSFIIIYVIVAAIFMVANAVLFAILAMENGGIIRFLLIFAWFSELLLVVILFIISEKSVDRAYEAVDQASDMMAAIIRDDEADIEKSIDMQLTEGSIGILYDNFGKLVNMFREGKNREVLEKEYLKDVMSDISHQLKTPLASMEVFLDLLINDKIQDESERKKILGETSNQVSRMEWMVLSMLKLARIEAGAVTFDIQEVNLKMVLEEVRGGTHYLTDSRNQSLKISCDDNVMIQADFDWLVEAIINIVKNASDYSVDNADQNDKNTGQNNYKPADIEVEVEQNSVYTRIYIRDHGIGMDEETMTHIFERFYRAGSDVNPNSVGIGLSLSKSIVEGMGGKISVDSTLGQGSCFKLQF